MNISHPVEPDPRIAFFDNLAPRWDAECSHPDETLRRLAGLNGSLALAPGQHLLEIGCGTGQITGWLARSVAPGRVVAADFSPAMLAQARRRNLDAGFVLLDICSTPPPAASFDVVLCFNAFPHFRDQPAALRHIAHSLKPAGTLLILHLVGSAAINAFHQNLTGPVSHDLLPQPAAWPDLLAGSGLRPISLVDQSDLFLLKAARASRGAVARPNESAGKAGPAAWIHPHLQPGRGFSPARTRPSSISITPGPSASPQNLWTRRAPLR